VSDRSRGRLVAWIVLVAAVSAIQFAGRFSGARPEHDVLFRYDTAIGEAVFYGLILIVVLAITAGLARRRLFALRPPVSWPRAAALALAVLVAVYVLSVGLDPVLHAGREQGLTTSHWRPHRAGAFAANAAVFAVFGPAVEELTFRGLGFRLLERFGHWTAIVLIGIAFGLWHGLVDAFPLLAAVGAGLAYVRSRTRSLYPCFALHAVFNGLALGLPFVR
jgi:membrane protease YdiL (CAAX protease family)